MLEKMLQMVIPMLGLDPELIRSKIDTGIKIAEEYNARLARIEAALNITPSEKDQ